MEKQNRDKLIIGYRSIEKSQDESCQNEPIGAKIIEHTIKNSNFQTKRDYISLSHIYLSAEEIIYQYKNGFDESVDIKLKCYKGYQMEKDLVDRLKKIYNNLIETDIEISIFNNLVKGHPDFSFCGFPGDCKSVLMDDWLPKNGKVSKKVYWQIQAYMKYSGKKKGLLIFESRESGKIVDIWIKENVNIQKEIDLKLNKIINLI